MFPLFGDFFRKDMHKPKYSDGYHRNDHQGNSGNDVGRSIDRFALE